MELSLAKNIQHQSITPQSASFLEKCNEREPRIKPLFSRFAAIFGYAWTSTISEPQELLAKMLEWEEAINDLENHEIERAIKTCKYTCEFISIAAFRKAAIGIVSPERAYGIIEKDDLAKQAWLQIDPWIRKTAPEKEVKKEFMANYNNLSERLLMGETYD